MAHQAIRSTLSVRGLMAGLLAVLAFASASASPLDLSGYELVWSDEFNGEELDRTAWNVEVNGTGCGNHELQHYIDSPATVSVSDGRLHLTACPALRGECGCPDHDFISGRINSRDKRTFLYGVVQASVRLPETANGLWPAFWMMGNDISSIGWPGCGEVDILEMGHADGIKTGTQSRLFNGALHWGNGEHYQAVSPRTAVASLQDGRFHTFTLVWEEDRVEMYLDDEEEPYLTHDISVSNDATLAGQYFHKPAFILFNLAVGGDFPDIHSRDEVTALSDGPRSMDVDYIRIYQKKNDLSATTTTPTK